MREVTVSFLPEMMRATDVAGRTAIVVDLLRASTTLVHAIESGAACVLPCLTTEDAILCRTQRSSEGVLLGGERQGVLIAGFDLANSPSHYTREKVGGRKLAFTTTNGTRAIHAAVGAA